MSQLYIEKLYETLRQGKDLVESTLAHVSHGGPTREEAEKWLANAKVALQEPDETVPTGDFTARCQSRYEDGTRCELREGHMGGPLGGKHLGGVYIWH